MKRSFNFIGLGREKEIEMTLVLDGIPQEAYSLSRVCGPRHDRKNHQDYIFFHDFK
jgi:hypothetical protein